MWFENMRLGSFLAIMFIWGSNSENAAKSAKKGRCKNHTERTQWQNHTWNWLVLFIFQLQTPKSEINRGKKDSLSWLSFYLQLKASKEEPGGNFGVTIYLTMWNLLRMLVPKQQEAPFRSEIIGNFVLCHLIKSVFTILWTTHVIIRRPDK